MSTSAELRGRRFVLVVPLGAHEQHGPHLPLDTDTRIAVELCRRAATHRGWVEVGPSIGVTASDEHAGFHGTLSLGTDLTAEILIAVARSALDNSPTCVGTVFVNAHGGNHDALARAERTLAAADIPAAFWSFPAPEGSDLHAGRTETSVMLAISPHDVQSDSAERGDVRPLGDLLPELRTVGVAGVSPNGVLGDPSGANADEGRRILDHASGDLDAFLLDRATAWGLGTGTIRLPR